MGQLKLITFDLDNTLWPALEVIVAAEQAGSRFLASRYPEHRQRLQPESLRSLRSRILKKSPELRSDLSALRRQTNERALLSCGILAAEARNSSELAFEVFTEARNRVRLFEGVDEMLRRLSGRYQLGALTNGNSDLRRIGIEHHFGFFYSSEMVGARKPAPDMFQAVLRAAQVRAGESLHVGDHPVEDVHAARNLGFHTVWVNVQGSSWPSNLLPPSHGITAWQQFDGVLQSIESQSP